MATSYGEYIISNIKIDTLEEEKNKLYNNFIRYEKIKHTDIKIKQNIAEIILKNINFEIKSYEEILFKLYTCQNNSENKLSYQDNKNNFDKKSYNEDILIIIKNIKDINKWLIRTNKIMNKDDFSKFERLDLAILWLIASSEKDTINIAKNVFNDYLDDIQLPRTNSNDIDNIKNDFILNLEKIIDYKDEHTAYKSSLSW